MTKREQAIRKDVRVLREFTKVYCRQKHDQASLCDHCRGLLAYSIRRRRKCPFDPKPACRNCKAHCYAKPRRSEIREVMRVGGMNYIIHDGPSGLLKTIKSFLTPNRKGKTQ